MAYWSRRHARSALPRSNHCCTAPSVAASGLFTLILQSDANGTLEARLHTTGKWVSLSAVPDGACRRLLRSLPTSAPQCHFVPSRAGRRGSSRTLPRSRAGQAPSRGRTPANPAMRVRAHARSAPMHGLTPRRSACRIRHAAATRSFPLALARLGTGPARHWLGTGPALGRHWPGSALARHWPGCSVRRDDRRLDDDRVWRRVPRRAAQSCPPSRAQAGRRRCSGGSWSREG